MPPEKRRRARSRRPKRTLKRWPTAAVRELAGPYESLLGRTRACWAVRELVGPYESLPGASRLERSSETLLSTENQSGTRGNTKLKPSAW